MSPSLQSILGAEALTAFETPGPVARGLPAAAYTSEAFFALENERMFADSWVFAGLAHELARPGDVVPVTVAGRPVLLVRDGTHEVRAFHNVCRHRCLKLVDEPGNAGPTIQCPYHSWTYRLDGALHIAPYFGGRDPRAVPAGFDRAQHGLVPVKAATWHDWIFVNLSGSAPPIEDFVAPLQRQLDGLDLTRMRHVVTVDLGEIGANWKLLMENFIEPYHVPIVHATTTEQPLTDHYTVNEPGCLGCAVDVSGGAKRTTRCRRIPATSRFSPTSCSGSTSRIRSACTSTCPWRRTAPSSAARSTASDPSPCRPNRRSSSRRFGATCTWRTRRSASGSSRAAPPMSPTAAACSLRYGRTRCGASRNSW